MNWPDKDSPFWPLARQVLVSGSFIAAVTFWYAGGLIPTKDIPALLTVLGPMLGYDVLKHFATKEK